MVKPAAATILEFTTDNIGLILDRLKATIANAKPYQQKYLLVHLEDVMDDMDWNGLFGPNNEHDPRREPPAEQPGPFGDDATSWYAASDSTPPKGTLGRHKSPLQAVRLEDGRLATAHWFPGTGWKLSEEFFGCKITHYRPLA